METLTLGILATLAVIVMAAYLWLRMGPRRCPGCGKLCYGIWGLARMYLKCGRCGREFDGPSTPH